MGLEEPSASLVMSLTDHFQGPYMASHDQGNSIVTCKLHRVDCLLGSIDHVKDEGEQ
jgi:hypothetical protein